jgi:hypothetical protein
LTPLKIQYVSSVRFRSTDQIDPASGRVKVSGRRPSQDAGLGTGRRTETAHVEPAGSAHGGYGDLAGLLMPETVLSALYKFMGTEIQRIGF